MQGTTKADVWRYLVLYVYGGIYADIDAAPTKLTPEMMLQHDAFFVVEQYHLASQWFMAASPRHPLMRYALNEALKRLLDASDIGKVRAAMVTGPHALHRGLIRFAADVGHSIVAWAPGRKPVKAGTYQGTDNRTVTVVGVGEHQNEFVNRDVVKRTKLREYEQMGMRHFASDLRPRGVSCRQAIDQSKVFTSG